MLYDNFLRTDIATYNSSKSISPEGFDFQSGLVSTHMFSGETMVHGSGVGDFVRMVYAN